MSKPKLMSDESWTLYKSKEARLTEYYRRQDPVEKNEMEEILGEIAAHIILSDPKAMWDAGSGGFTPNKNLTTWKSTDGGVLKVTLFDIMMSYTDDTDFLVDLLYSRDPEEVVRQHVKAAVKSQEEFEYKQQTGDL